MGRLWPVRVESGHYAGLVLTQYKSPKRQHDTRGKDVNNGQTADAKHQEQQPFSAERHKEKAGHYRAQARRDDYKDKCRRRNEDG
jgi:hypothetical protein